MKNANTRAHPEAAPPPALTQDQVRRKAYELYLARKGGPGTPESDWLKAEQELKAGGNSTLIESKAYRRGEVLLKSGDI